MNVYPDKAKTSRGNSVSNVASQRQRSNTPALQFVDNRPQAARVQNTQRMANNSMQAKEMAQMKSILNRDTSTLIQKKNTSDELQMKTALTQRVVDEEELQMKANPIQKVVEEEELQMKAKPIQRVVEEELQMKAAPIQKVVEEEELQMKAAPIQRMENKTGLSDSLKTGVETLSGIDISDVRVHRNSAKPASVQAHAYTQGSNIHVAPGQEKYMAHEAWHVVQQKQGRVQPTVSVNGMAVNDNPGLENEADMMGAKAASL